ncbi:unnamed protein product [Closterium sp. Yama58-4]|nr:unnamed protein product [Closterium sp. Yama58-4]
MLRSHMEHAVPLYSPVQASATSSSVPQLVALEVSFGGGNSLASISLISPCACTGTQAYVHLACLRQWQWAVMASRHPGTNYTPALVCSVCTQRFSVAPPRLSIGLRLLRLIEFYSRELTGFFVFLVTCYVLLVFHMEFATLIFQLHSLFHTISRTLWREGASVSVHPGMLLVASPSMPIAASIFYQSVVLLYDYHPSVGISGIVINKPMQDDELGSHLLDLPKSREQDEYAAAAPVRNSAMLAALMEAGRAKSCQA